MPESPERDVVRGSSNEITSLLQQAGNSFYSKRFPECEQIIKRLSESTPNDTKIRMNKALLEYVFKHGCSQTESFLDELKQIGLSESIQLSSSTETNSNVLSTEEDEPMDDAYSACISTPTIRSGSSTSICLRYNYALVLFYQRQYEKAERFLNACLGWDSTTLPITNLVSSISSLNFDPPTDVLLYRRVLLLWLEVQLELRRPGLVFTICSSWLMILSSTSLVAPVHTISPVPTDRTQSPSNSHRFTSEQLSVIRTIRRPIQLFYIRTCLLTGRLDAAQVELDQVQSESVDFTEVSPTNQSMPGKSDSHSDCSLVIEERNVLLFRAQLSYLRNKHSEALRLLSEIPSQSQAGPIETGRCESSMLWNNFSLVHHRVGQYNLSGLQIRRALRQTDRTIHHDLLGNTRGNKINESHHGKSAPHQTSSGYNQLPLRAFSVSQHHTLLYNFGIQLLFAQKPAAAFPILLQLIPIYPRNPRLWFRLAECCIKVHQPNNVSWWKLEAKSKCVIETVGVGPCRTLMLAHDNQTISKPWLEAASMSTPTLEFASLCLHNALFLLPRPPPDLGLSSEGTKLSAEDEHLALIRWAEHQAVPVLPAPTPLYGMGLLHLLCASHLSASYVALSLNNPVEVLHTAGHLLSPSEGCLSNPFESNILQHLSPPAYQYLARLYLAEALVMLDRLQEAVSLLRSQIPSSDPAVGDSSELCQSMQGLIGTQLRPRSLDHASGPVWIVGDSVVSESLGCSFDSSRLTIYSNDFPANAAQATGLFLYNYAVVLSMDRQWVSAEQWLTVGLPGLKMTMEQLSDHKWPEHIVAAAQSHELPCLAVLLQIYLKLVLNKPEQALQLARDSFGHMAFAGRLTSSSDQSHRSKLPVRPKQSEKEWTLNDIYKLLQDKSSPSVNSDNNLASKSQRSSNLWASNEPSSFAISNQHSRSGFHISPMMTNQPPPPLQLYSQPPPQQPLYSSVPWEHHHQQQQQQQQRTQPPSGLLLSTANENEWPPL